MPCLCGTCQMLRSIIANQVFVTDNPVMKPSDRETEASYTYLDIRFQTVYEIVGFTYIFTPIRPGMFYTLHTLHGSRIHIVPRHVSLVDPLS